MMMTMMKMMMTNFFYDNFDAFTLTKVSQQGEEAIDKKIPPNLQLCNRTGPGDDDE